MLLAALMALLGASQGSALPRGPKERCCFEVAVQVNGAETVNYGNGTTPPYTFKKGMYTAHWRFAFRKLMKLERATDGSYDLRAAGRFPFHVSDHPHVALHDWTVEWSFSDTPSGVQTACCFQMKPHGWKAACAQGSTTLATDGLTENSSSTPRVSLSTNGVVVVVGIRKPAGVGFVCGLNDGRLDPTIGPLWEAGLKPPSLQRLLTDRVFAQNCSESASEPGDSREITGSTGNVEARATFSYFSVDQLYDRAKALDSLTGKNAPGFNGPPATPNRGPRCERG